MKKRNFQIKSYSVKYTTNLGMFKLHPVNRKTDDAESKRNIKEISEDMLKNGFRPERAIVINSAGFIVDGQHRLLAAQSIGVGVYYMVDETVGNSPKAIFDAFVKYNENVKVVRKNDYVHGYSTLGNDSYKTLEQFGNEFPMFSLTERMMLLNNSGTRHIDKKEFSQGKFKVEDLGTAREIANNILSLKPYFEKGYNKSVFVRTLLTIMEKKPDFKFEEFLHKVKLRPSSIYMCGDKKSYAEMIEDIYNYKRRNDEKLNLRF